MPPLATAASSYDVTNVTFPGDSNHGPSPAIRETIGTTVGVAAPEVSMPSLISEFRNNADINHQQHEALMESLARLDSALAGLICYSEVFADLATVQDVYESGRELAHFMPRHFEHEERAVLEPATSLRPELLPFSTEMKRQHQALRAQLETFCSVMEQLEDTEDLEQCICTLKQKGQEFTHQFAVHMGTEERHLHRGRSPAHGA